MDAVARTPAGVVWHKELWRTIGAGIVAGLVAAVLMGIFAMVAAATYQDTGFFTPMYHIASPLIGGEAMTTSMEGAARLDMFTFDAGPAVVGAALHMMVGAIWGAVFFALLHVVRAQGPATLVVSGVAFGLAVMLFMSWVTLPLTAAIVGGGKPVENMPMMVGWATFSIEHALFGLVLGMWVAARSRTAAEEGVGVAAHRRAA